MCGLIGYSGKEPLIEANIKILFLYSQTRGDFASGFWTEDGLEKGNHQASYLIAKNKIPTKKVLIGHTRNPSRNTGRQENNAQPFEFDKIVGAHNGFCYGLTSYSTKNNLRNDASDSYNAFHLLNDQGLENTRKEITNSSNYTFLWFDKEDGTVNFFKDGKPLFYGFINKNMYIASEEEFLEAIECEDITAAGFRTHYKVKDGKILKQKKAKTYTKANYGGATDYDLTPRGNNSKKPPTYHENVPKILGKDAPDDAEAIMFGGVKRYYWLEGKILYVESCYTPRDTEVEGFDLSKEGGSEKAARKYLEIVNNVNKQLS